MVREEGIHIIAIAILIDRYAMLYLWILANLPSLSCELPQQKTEEFVPSCWGDLHLLLLRLMHLSIGGSSFQRPNEGEKAIL